MCEHKNARQKSPKNNSMTHCIPIAQYKAAFQASYYEENKIITRKLSISDAKC